MWLEDFQIFLPVELVSDIKFHISQMEAAHPELGPMSFKLGFADYLFKFGLRMLNYKSEWELPFPDMDM